LGNNNIAKTSSQGNNEINRVWQIIEIYVNKVATKFYIFESLGRKQMLVQAFG